MRKAIVTGKDITVTFCVDITEEMAKAIERRPTELKNLLRDLKATNGIVCKNKQDQDYVFEMSVCIENVFIMQREMARFEKIERQFVQQITKWVEEDAAKAIEKEEPETGIYVCLKKTKQGYEVEGNMPFKEVVNTLASMFISYAANKK